MKRFDSNFNDFPRTEIWRLQADGWQSVFGPKNFRDVYYKGMDNAYRFIKEHYQEPLSPDFILGLYETAAAYEDGFSAYKEGKFGGIADVIYVTPDNPMLPVIGISKAGISEFVDAYLESQKEKNFVKYQNRDLPVWNLWLNVEGSGKIPLSSLSEIMEELRKRIPNLPNDFSIKFNMNINTVAKQLSSDELKTFFEVCFEHQAKLYNANISNQKNNVKPSLEFQRNYGISIEVRPYIDRNNLVPVMQNYIDNFNKEIQSIENEASPERDQKILAAIAALAQKLHRQHFFCDGNGRTFILLMINALLLKYNLPFAVIFTPAHFTAFSINELVNELQAGMKYFEDCKVTSLKHALQNLTGKDIQQVENLKEKIRQQLSKDPFIALAQLNELFLQIQTNQFKVPCNYRGDQYDNSLLNFFSKTFHLQHLAHNQMLSSLKDIYLEIVQAMFANGNVPCKNAKVKVKGQEEVEAIDTTTKESHGKYMREVERIQEYSMQDVFYHLIENHAIIRDTNYLLSAHQNKSIKTILANDEGIQNYFADKRDFGVLGYTRLY